MSGIGAGAFVEGLQGGIAARDQMDKNKQFKQMRKLGIAEKTLDIQGKRDTAMADQMRQLGGDFDQAAFDADYPAFQQDKDPALLRFGKFLGGKLGGMFGGKGEEGAATAQMAIATPEVQEAGLQASGATTYGIPNYADGGQVDHERMQRSYGDDLYTTPEEAAANRAARSRGEHRNQNPYTRGKYSAGRKDIPTSGGGIREFGKDLARSASSVFDDTIAVANEGGGGAQQQFRDAENARDYGAAASEQVRAGLGTGVALAKDVFVDNPITQFAAGLVGFDGNAEEGVPTSDVPTTPEGDAIGASVDNPEASAEAVAEVAIDDAKQESLENLDYKLLVDQGMRPEDIPVMSTGDWAEYRRRMTMGLAKQGMNPLEAHQQVDQQITHHQMAGFQREGNKALLYMQTGQNREAAMALQMAYQYFPNGVGVKFGTVTDPKTGQPAMVSMGVDEETGEPTGAPMLITTERLATMMENMQNPDAFRSWTKDGRDLQLEINKLQSIDDYRQGSLDISAYDAETDRIGELTSGTGGLRPADRDRRDKEYGERMAEAGIMEEGFEDPNVTRSLASAMTIYEQLSGLDMNTVTHEVLAAYQEDPQNGVQRLLESARGQ